MMSPVEIIIRLILGVLSFFFFVWNWSWRVYINDAEMTIDDDYQVLSIFVGNTVPVGIEENFFLISRGFFGLTLVIAALWRVPEALLMGGDKRYTADMCIVTFGVCAAFFALGLVMHGYNIGFLTFGQGLF